MSTQYEVDQNEPCEKPEEFMDPAHGGGEIVITRSGEAYATLTVAAADAAIDLVWSLEQAFWTGDESFYRERLGENCLMIFPAPVGILSGDAIVESLSQAPRWRSVAMNEQEFGVPSSGFCILAYRAHAERDDSRYEAFCSSAYARVDDKWVLVQHQQTPI